MAEDCSVELSGSEDQNVRTEDVTNLTCCWAQSYDCSIMGGVASVGLSFVVECRSGKQTK